VFIGHFAAAYAAKRLAPQTSLGTLFTAAQLPDVLWPVLLIAGVEHAEIAPGDTAFTPLRFDSYPISHSLVTVVAWGALFGAVHFWGQRRKRDAVVLAALVVSHWLLDFVSHRPDMPLWPGGPKLGLGLWNHVGATVGIEVLMFAFGLWLARDATRAARPDRQRGLHHAGVGAAAALRRERRGSPAAEHDRRRVGGPAARAPFPRARRLGRPSPRAATVGDGLYSARSVTSGEARDARRAGA
jgi:hypothetical protein